MELAFHRFQMFAWAAVLGVILIVSVLRQLVMLDFSATLLGLMGISSGTYIGFKFPEQKNPSCTSWKIFPIENDMSQPVNKPFGLNQSLGYLPWTQLLDGIDDFSKGFIRGSCVGKNESPRNTIQLLPGMKLVVEDSSVIQQGTNMYMPGISRYDWVVPTGAFGPADYFFLSYLLMSCQPDPGAEGAASQDPVKLLRAAVERLASASPINLAQQVSDLLKPLISSLLVVNVRAGEWSAKPGTASRVREWLTQPSSADFGAADYPSPYNPSQSLRAQIPLNSDARAKPVSITAFRSGSAFFLDNVPQPGGPLPPSNAWYKNVKNINFRRQRLEITIPVRASQSVPGVSGGWQYVPVYYSIADLENDLGVKCAGIRRRPDLVGCIKDQGLVEIDPTSLVSPLDQRAGISFVDHDPLQAADIVFIPDVALKSDLLLAPGDILVVH